MTNYIMENVKKKTCKSVIVFLFLCVCMVAATGVNAEAATTCSSGISFTATTTAKVNIRKKAGTKYKSYGMLSKNQKVTVLGYVTNKGIKWYKCKGKVNGKTKTGYVSSAYIKMPFPAGGTVNSKVKSYLNVRKSAKTSSSSLLKIKKGEKANVLGITKKSGKYWYKIKVTSGGKTKTGYVLGKYVDVSSAGTTDENKNTTSTENEPKEGYVNSKVTSYLNIRKSASTSAEVLLKVPQKTVVSVLGTTGDWYKIKVTYDKKTVTGYAMKDYITLGTYSTEKATETTTEKTTEKTTENPTAPVTEKEFQTLLNEFPDSYKTSLTELHKAYPNWKFVAVKTNLDWNTVIQNESVVGRNVIQSNYPKGTASLAPFSYLSTDSGAYNWATDKYTLKDGTNWYSADTKVIQYYMDPRNFLNSTDIFQYEALAYDSSHSENVVQSILNNTFMKGSYSVTDSATNKKVTGTYKQAFMDAGRSAMANPYFLATRVKQEVGANGSNSTSGTYKGYEGIYNYYNIGANDGANAVANGLKWAKTGTTYGRPWTNPYKSIVGGAKYIAANYINKGQNTLYFQKFNVASTDLKNAPLYSHQYMTNVQAPYSEGRITRSAYNSLGILNDTMVFYIPVYNNMPNAKCALPTAAGNPNPYLSSLKVYSGTGTSSQLTISPTFAYNKFDYTMAVSKSVSKVTITASPVSKYATVSGTGTVDLNDPGKTTTVKITGKAQNGKTQQYTINITRKAQ